MNKYIKELSLKQGVRIKEIEHTEDENMYQKGITANIDKKKTPKPMESLSILSNHVKYVQYDESDSLHNVNLDSLNYHVNEDIYKDLKEQEML